MLPLDKLKFYDCCDFCIKDHQCKHEITYDCFITLNNKDFTDKVLELLKKQNTPSKKLFLTRQRSKNISFNDGIATLDSYYVSMINDSIRSLRAGKIAYLFNWNQIIEILRYVPDIKVSVKNHIFYVKLQSSDRE